MALLGELVVSFSADLSGLLAGIAQAQAALSNLSSSSNTVALASSFDSATVAADDLAASVAGIPDANLATVSTAADDLAASVVVAGTSTSSLGSTFASVSTESASLADAFASQMDILSSFGNAYADLQQMGESLWSSLQQGASAVVSFGSTVASSLAEAASGAIEFGSEVAGSLKEGVNGFLDFGEKLGLTITGFTEMKFAAFTMVEGLVSSNAAMEQTKIAFTTLLGSSQAAGSYLQTLWNFAAKTPFQFPTLANASQQLLAFGYKAKDTVPMLTTLGDALSAMGRTDAGSLQEIVSIFGQMNAAGKVNAMDMMRLTYLGIPGWKLLADSMHLSVTQVQELSKKGKLLSSEAIPELLAGLHQTFGGAMANQALTFNGLLTTVKDNLQAAWRTVSGPLFDQAKAALVTFGNLVASPSFQQGAVILGQGVANAFKIIGQVLGATVVPAFHTLQTALGPVGAALSQVFAHFSVGTIGAQFSGVMGIITSFKNILAGLSPVVSALGSSFMSSVVPALGKLMAALGGGAQGQLTTFGHLFQQIAEWVSSSLGPALAYLLPQIMALVGAIIGAAVPVLTNWWHLLQNLASLALPPLMGAIEFLVPLVLRLAGAIAGGLALAFTVLGPLIGGLVGALAAIAGFFAQNEVAAALLKGALIALAVPLGVLALTVLPALIVEMGASLIATLVGAAASLWATAAAAFGAAAGFIMLNWPILLILLGIALLAAGIILLVSHWGQVVAFLRGLWQGFASWFGGIMSSIGTFFHNIWEGIVNFFRSNWNTIINIAKIGAMAILTVMTGGLALVVMLVVTHWNQIIGFFRSAWTFITTIAQNIANAVVNAFEWMYNHNYFFKMLVDFITNAITGLKNFLTGAWDFIKTAASDAWNWISSTASSVWNTITSTIKNFVQAALSWLNDRWEWLKGVTQAAWNFISNFIHMEIIGWQNIIQSGIQLVQNILQAGWNFVTNVVQTAWNTIHGAISAGISTVQGVIQGFIGWLGNTFGGLASQAFSWGANLIQGLINGIGSLLGNLKNMAANAISSLGNLLGFHSPAKEGPGADADKWMPNLMGMMTSGILLGIPGLRSAALQAAGALSTMLPAGGFAASGAGFGGGSSAQQRTASIYVQLDGRTIAQVIAQPLVDTLRVQSGIRL